MADSINREQIIHDAAMQIMQNVGVAVHNAKAVQILKDNGIRVEGDIAYFTEEQVMEWIGKAPESFTIKARNPKYDAFIGGDTVNPIPTYGCAFIDDWDGNRRRGTMDDYMKCLKLVYAEDSYKFDGGILVQPSDVPEDVQAIEMFYATLTHSDKAIMLPTGYKNEMETIVQMAAEVFGGKEALAATPRMIALINTVSPLALDERMLDCLMILAEAGQPVIVCPSAMLGATSSVSMAGTIASSLAESLAGIAITQMIRPGTPVVLGIQSTAADFRGVTFACAAPEGTIMQGYAARMGRFYHLPSRGGGCQTDAPVINCQAGYESMLTFYSAYRHGINVVLEAGGVMDSVNATSIEKMIVDFEIIRQVIFSFTPIDVDEEALNLEEIEEIAQTGSFVTSDSTLDNYTDLYMPRVGLRNASGSEYFKESIDAEYKRLMQVYESNRPTLDDETNERLKAILAGVGIDGAACDAIRAM